METFLLVHVPTLVLALGIVGLTTGSALLGLRLVRKRVSLSTLADQHDVAGVLLALIGGVYAVLLAFVVVIVWQQLGDAQAAAQREATTVGTIYRDSFAFGPRGAGARQALDGYARSVADVEWPTMAAHHRESRATDRALNRVWLALQAVAPRGAAQAAYYRAAVDGLVEATKLRRMRVLDSGTELPAPLWAVLLIGAAISIGFTYFFGVKNFRAQLLMVGAVSSLIGLVLFLILELDLPFTGSVDVGPAAMQAVIGEFAHYAD